MRAAMCEVLPPAHEFVTIKKNVEYYANTISYPHKDNLSNCLIFLTSLPYRSQIFSVWLCKVLTETIWDRATTTSQFIISGQAFSNIPGCNLPIIITCRAHLPRQEVPRSSSGVRGCHHGDKMKTLKFLHFVAFWSSLSSNVHYYVWRILKLFHILGWFCPEQCTFIPISR